MVIANMSFWMCFLLSCWSVRAFSSELKEKQHLADISPLVNDGHCTTVAVGRKAMADASTVTTHNADCQECDMRVNHVPARDWPSGVNRPVFDMRLAYPRALETEELNIHGPSYLVGTEDSSIYPWQPLKPLMYLEQVEHTFGYTMGTFPLQNDKQLTMGESTCETTFWSIPSYYEGGKANFNIRSLMEVAMERCATARCAIRLMGSLAEEYGFYGPEDGPIATDGEALTIGDPFEVWVFHIVPDDTHASAVWVAQRVPDDHVTVIANQFIITTIDLNKPDEFMASTNIYDVAKRSKRWVTEEEFNFLKVYGKDQGPSSQGSNRRLWRVFTLVSPSISLSPLTDSFATFGYGPTGALRYPFSVKPDQPISVADLMAIMRDYYADTPFDLSEDAASGPFGDVIRSGGMDTWQDPVNGVSGAEQNIQDGSISFPSRAISIWRTSTSTIAQARQHLPDAIGGVVWVAQYAPHHSSYTPLYVGVNSTPSSLDNVTYYKFDKTKNFWAHSVVGNYVSRWFKWTIKDVKTFQHKLEKDIFSQQVVAETAALKAHRRRTTSSAEKESTSGSEEATDILQRFQEKTASGLVDAWWEFFIEMVTKYRDITRVTNYHAENYRDAVEWINYPRWWMEMVGFWGSPGAPSHNRPSPVGVPPLVLDTLNSPEEYRKLYPDGVNTRYYISSTTTKPISGEYSNEASAGTSTFSTGVTTLPGGATSLGFIAIGVVLGLALRHLYDNVLHIPLVFSTRYRQLGYTPVKDVSGPEIL